MKRLLLTVAVIACTVPALTQMRYTAPRTPWGDPDLQGVWPGDVTIPLQRPVEFGERPTLTDEEFAAREAQARRVRVNAVGPPDHWLERGRPTRQASLIVDPPNGRLPELTPEAVRRRAQARPFTGDLTGDVDSYTDFNMYLRCVTRGLLGSILPTVTGNGNEIVQAPGVVVIRHEMIHESRVISLDGRPHPGQGIRMYMGDSRGHWEGDTLVVETTNFTDKVAIGPNGAGGPLDPGYHSQALRIVERFTRTRENTFEYRATVDDPQTWMRPWTILIPLTRSDNYQVHEYACHEGNYAMRNILSGARTDDASRK